MLLADEYHQCILRGFQLMQKTLFGCSYFEISRTSLTDSGFVLHTNLFQSLHHLHRLKCVVHALARHAQLLADHLYEEVKAERKAAATTDGCPKIRREDMHISPEVMKLVEDIEPLPDDFDYDKARLEYLLKKHG